MSYLQGLEDRVKRIVEANAVNLVLSGERQAEKELLKIAGDIAAQAYHHLQAVAHVTYQMEKNRLAMDYVFDAIDRAKGAANG